MLSLYIVQNRKSTEGKDCDYQTNYINHFLNILRCTFRIELTERSGEKKIAPGQIGRGAISRKGFLGNKIKSSVCCMGNFAGRSKATNRKKLHP